MHRHDDHAYPDKMQSVPLKYNALCVDVKVCRDCEVCLLLADRLPDV